MMDVKKTNLDNLLVIESDKFFDHRGWFQVAFHINEFMKKNMHFTFKQDNLVYSKQNVLRGLHIQKNNPQGKLVSCIKGAIFDVAIDLRKKSNTYRQWKSFFLSEDDNKFIYIPEGFAHGYSVQSNEALVHYKCTENYDPRNEVGIIWNDSDINISWPENPYILSDKDKSNKSIEELNL